jgi:hypothetical protein
LAVALQADATALKLVEAEKAELPLEFEVRLEPRP